jgi:NAD(P)-dependent dehydrogenase (short-subunit alcohol dehydrogenase family)
MNLDAHSKPIFTAADATVVVTGGASGIGAALCAELLFQGAANVIVADLDGKAAATVAARLNAQFKAARSISFAVDTSAESTIEALIERVESAVGPISLWCSNAGVHRGKGLGHPDDWEVSFDVNVLAHVIAARHVMPRMLSRGQGNFVITASAAGLLSDVRSAAYTASKHAAVGFAEWLAIQHVTDGIGIHCVCPESVRTGMSPGGAPTSARRVILEPDEVARVVLAGVKAGQFLILPHPRVEEYERRRIADRPRWFAAMHATVAHGPSIVAVHPQPQG